MAEALEGGCYHIKWTICPDLPSPLYSVSVAVCGNNVYALGQSPNEDNHHQVFCYDILTKQWDKLPPTKHRHGILHIIDQKLTIFGGTDPVTKECHNKVSTYDHDTNSWCKCYPDMIHNRHMPGVIIHNDYVIVMGGNSSPDTVLDSIEVMNYHQQLQWKEASVHLPVPMWAFKPTISGEYITIVGYSHNEGRNNGCYQIPVEVIISLLNQPLSTGAVTGHWKELSPATHWDTATVLYSNPPVIIGGCGPSNQGGVSTSDISLYDSSKNSWRKVDSLTSTRSTVGVALLNSNSIIVIGGSSSGVGVEAAMASSLTTVEIGNIVPNQ